MGTLKINAKIFKINIIINLLNAYNKKFIILIESLNLFKI